MKLIALIDNSFHQNTRSTFLLMAFMIRLCEVIEKIFERKRQIRTFVRVCKINLAITGIL